LVKLLHIVKVRKQVMTMKQQLFSNVDKKKR
jgi:hypothetical protein